MVNFMGCEDVSEVLRAIKIDKNVAVLVLRHDPRGLRAPLDGTITVRARKETA